MKKTIKLNNGVEMPTIGLGTWKSEKGAAGNAIQFALEDVGYKHIDCASRYGNEAEIGDAFTQVFTNGKVKRENVFITSKLWNTDHHPKKVIEACKKTLSDLKLEYLDLYLIHWAIAFIDGPESDAFDEDGVVKTENISIRETWEAMEELVKMGLVKSIGVSNFNTQSIIDVLSYAKIKPVVNQIEIHPHNNQAKFLEFLKRKEIVPVAYSPLGNPSLPKSEGFNLIENNIIKKISSKYNKSAAQILLNWAVQRNYVVIPKSTNPIRIKENFDIFDFELDQNDVDKINALNKDHRFVDPITFWGIPYFS